MFNSHCARGFRACMFLLVVLFLTGCVAHNLEKAPRGLIPITPMAKNLPPYRIQVGDVLEIKMLLNPELEEELIVRPDGMVSTAVVQDVVAFGRTPSALQAELNALYKEQLSNPDVAVVVKTFAPTRVYVLGEVRSPGEYVSVGPNLTLLQALSRAGGVKNSAETKEVVILRRGSGENPVAYSANYDAATSGGDPGADVRLAAYDVVYVPRTTIAEAYLTYEQYIQQFITPSIGVSASYSLNKN